MGQPPVIEAVVLAGGFGTRLAKHVPGVPKPLAPVSDRPFFEHQIDWLAAQGVTRATITIHHLSEQFVTYINRRPDTGIELRIAEEAQPLGTGGAVKNAIHQGGIDQPLLVINGDTDFEFALPPLMAAHRAHKAAATVAVADVPNVARFGTVTMVGDRITGFVQASGAPLRGQVNAGAYILEPEEIVGYPGTVFSLETDFLPDLARSERLYGYVLAGAETFHDIGTPESYDQFRRTFEA